MKMFLLKKDNVKDLCLEASGEWETYVPLENIGGDGHCSIGDKFVCVDSPVFSYTQLKEIPDKEHVI